ncbi:MAG: alpha/beta fold hydrolase [Acidobacteria bacterium]|nr:alpha/beta fold hydrolase [Acidobacteriota bacterium]
MPPLKVRDTTCYYRLDGREDQPVLMLAHSLGQDHAQWDPQVAALSEHFRILRYDIRGHGASEVTPGDYRIEQLGNDALALAETLGIGRFAFCGLSLGGMIGLWIAVHAPDRMSAVVLANTSAKADGPGMEARRRTALSEGMGAVADTVMGRFFSPQALAAGGPMVDTSRRILLATDPVGYAGCCAAIRDMDQTGDLAQIRMPALIVSGDLDVSLPWTGHSAELARHLAYARVVHLPAAHLSNLGTPRSFNAALLDFLVPRQSGDAAAGMRVRRAVLGDAHVDRASTQPASADFQELITRYAWGTVWTRPGLDVRTRRLLVLTTMAALGRWEEFRLHLRTGFAHELEWCDVEEILLQVAVYAGVPAANTGFHIAAEERPGDGHPAVPPSRS